MKRIVNVADMIVSDDLDDVLITYALGPCLGVAIYDTAIGVGGLIHCQLPTITSYDQSTPRRVTQFVDTGVSHLLEQLFELGAEKRRLTIKVAGGAQVMGDLNVFKIAQRNYTVLRKLLWKNNLLIDAEEVGGDVARTMSLHIGTGSVMVRSPTGEWELVGQGKQRPAITGLSAG